METIRDDDELRDTDEAAAFLKRAKATLEKDRCAGKGPPFVKIGKLVRYRLSDLRAYRDGLPALRSTAEAAALRQREAAAPAAE
jgi:helix-turn-helix protein